MAKKIVGEDGQTYKMVESSANRRRTVEIILGVLSIIISVLSLASGFGLAAVGDAFGGGGSFTAELMFGIILSIAAFVLVFFINKKHALVSWLIIILGAIILIACGDFGIAGGILFIITGVTALIRK